MAEDIVVYERPGQSKRYAKIIFIGILLFLAVYFPFFGNTLRYQLGGMLDTLFTFIGTVSLIMGGVNLAIGVIGFFGKKMHIGNIVIGALLLWIGCWLTGIMITIFGFTFGGSTISNPGYQFIF
ncbi:MAG: hypothetical protein GF329_15420 [Candidatus Lokiarchaeota archaeon]|nr:hypothetical protein [Candidatus Lokiarchaeota archaeon]